MFGYKYDYYFAKGDAVELEMDKLVLAVPAHKGDIIQVTPKSQQSLPITKQDTYRFVIDHVTHLVGTGTLLKLRKEIKTELD